jgi:hypothetical protein
MSPSGQILHTVQTLACLLSPIADIRAQNVALASPRSARPPVTSIALRDLKRDRLFALFQLALLALAVALLVAGPDWRAGGRRLPTRLRQSVSFRQFRTCRYVGPGLQWARTGQGGQFRTAAPLDQQVSHSAPIE